MNPKEQSSGNSRLTKPGPNKSKGKSVGASGPKRVTWPKEYTEFATHPVQHALCRNYVFGNVHGKFRKAARIMLENVVPTDRDHEYYDGVTNQYKILKSLTSGARFYNQNTLFALKLGYRKCVIELARACGLLNSITAKLQVENAPDHAAWNLMSAGVGVSYLTALGNLNTYREKLAEAVSELNSIPMPNEGGLEELFKFYAHVYRDDHGKASDYYVFYPANADYASYADTTTGSGGVPGYMTAIVHTVIENMPIDTLLDDIINTCAALRASLDINNCMSDLIGAFPSSRFDWGSVLARHTDFERAMDADLATSLSSAPFVMGHASVAGQLSAAGDNVELQYQNLNFALASWDSHISDDQWVDTMAGASEASCYQLQLTVKGSGTGGAPQSGDRVDTTGLFVGYIDIFTTIGTPTTAATLDGVSANYNAAQSTIQSTAEEGGKRLAIAWMQFRALPKIDMARYGASASDDDLFWNPEDIRLVAMVDLENNIKAINMVKNNTTHLTTERQR